MSFDVAAARAQFPILQREIGGKPLIYLDSAASAQKPRAVMAAMTRASEYAYSNVHRGLHTLANETTEAYEAARETVRAFVNAPSVEEIVFTKGATEAINLVAASFGRGWGPDDEIVLTEMEHHANIVPWHFLRERQGVILRFAPVLEDGRLDLEALRNLIGPRTRMVAVSHMSNVLGTVNPVEEIVAWARAAGAASLSTAARRWCTKPLMFKRLARTSMSSPATSSTDPLASACCTAGRSGWPPCRRIRAVAR